MNMPVASSVSIETAVPGYARAAAALRSIRPVRYREAADDLASLDQVLRAARILMELKPGEIDKYHPENGWLHGDEDNSLGEAVMKAIGVIAPLDDEVVDIDLQDGYFRLVPAQMGYAMRWDTWEETVNDPGNYLSETDSVWAFCAALGIGDQAAFESFAEYFGWGLRWPKRAGGTYDKDKLFLSLDRRGMGCLKAAWDIAIYCTGNLYFDYNIYEDNLPLPEFSIAGVRKLEAEYLAAKQILAQYHMAQDLFSNQDGIPAALLRIYVRSLVKEEEKPRTLAEIFRAEQERMAADEDYENDATDPMGVLPRDNNTRIRVRG